MPDGEAVDSPVAPADMTAALSATPMGLPASEYTITLHRTELIPGGMGARLGRSDDFPDRQFLILPKTRAQPVGGRSTPDRQTRRGLRARLRGFTGTPSIMNAFLGCRHWVVARRAGRNSP